MTTHEVLVAARNLIDREGWGRGNESMRDHGPICVEGALARAAGMENVSCSQETYDAVRDLPAYGVFAQVVGRPGCSLFVWNDCVADTKEEVLAAFDQAIAETAPPPADPFESFTVNRISFREPVKA